MNEKIFIIAEAGVNHNGNIDLAFKLVDAAQKAGADAIKFQTFKTDKVVSGKTEMAAYQKANLGSNQSQFELIKKLELSYEQFAKLKEYCEQLAIMFLSTPDEEDSLDFLADDLKVPLIKVGSGEITNFPYLERIAQKKLPIMLSTGMANLIEVGEAIRIIQAEKACPTGTFFPPLTLLHCTTNYPTLYEEVNLRAMLTLKETFKLPVGYSDHTLGIEIPIAAATLGATVIEKHLTLDKNLSGPDHQASLEPDELQVMVRAVRNIEKALGNGVKEPGISEIRNMAHVRKSLIATGDLERGHILTETDITIKRPGTGLHPKFKEVVIGMKLTKNVREEDPIEWEVLKES